MPEVEPSAQDPSAASFALFFFAKQDTASNELVLNIFSNLRGSRFNTNV